MSPRRGSATGAVGPGRTLHLLVVAAIVAGLDQLTKAWAVAALSDGPIELIGDAVQFDLIRNRGGAFSLLSFDGVTPLLAVAAIALSLWLVYLGHREDDAWLVFGLALVLGGALGNLADRLFRDPGVFEGAVVDFVDVGAWPTFNLADAAITVGVVLLVLRGWATPDDDEHDDEDEDEDVGSDGEQPADDRR